MAERRPAVVIYDDENVLECLSQEMCQLAIKALLADEFECEHSGACMFFKSEKHHVRMSYGKYSGLHIFFDDLYPADDEIEAYMQQVEKKAKIAEIEALKARLAELEGNQ